MTTYAADTLVSVERSRAEIETTLSRYGASRFGYMVGANEAVIGFMAHGKFIKFVLPLPDPNNPEFTVQNYTYLGRVTRTAARAPEAARKLWEQACRSKWRSLGLAIKAKLNAVEEGITTFETEFLAHIVTPGGQTIGERFIPQLDQMQRTGKMPSMMMLEAPKNNHQRADAEVCARTLPAIAGPDDLVAVLNKGLAKRDELQPPFVKQPRIKE